MLWNQVVFLIFFLLPTRHLEVSCHQGMFFSSSPHFESKSYSNSLSSFSREMLSVGCHIGKDLNTHSCSDVKSCQVLEQGLQTSSIQMPSLIFSYGYQCWGRFWAHMWTQWKEMTWLVRHVLLHWHTGWEEYMAYTKLNTLYNCTVTERNYPPKTSSQVYLAIINLCLYFSGLYFNKCLDWTTY